MNLNTRNTMKPYYFILLCLVSVNLAKGQSCLPQGITFSTQAQIDNFHINYPGCKHIEGEVFIWPGDPNDITNLHGLSGLISCNSTLRIIHIGAVDLSGLDSLQ